jgi:hypothetical protein
MASNIIIWFLAVVAVEAITEIIISSVFFAPIREFIWNTRFLILHKLFACGYCMSVWVSAAVAFVVPWPTNSIFGYFLLLFALHRLSNLFHEFSVRWLDRIKINGTTTADTTESNEVISE